MAHIGGGDIDTESFYDNNQNIDDDSDAPDTKVFYYKKRFDRH